LKLNKLFKFLFVNPLLLLELIVDFHDFSQLLPDPP